MVEKSDRNTNRALRARFAEVYGEYERLRSGLDDLQRQLTKVQVSERSDDGLVTATVGPRGQLVSVELDPAVFRDRDAARLSRTITETVHRATAAATAATQQLVAAYLPNGSGALDYLRDGTFGSLLRRSDAALHEEMQRHD